MPTYAIKIHGLASPRDKKGRPVKSVLVEHEAFKEPTWIPASVLQPVDGQGEVTYNSTKPIPRKVEISDKHARRLGLPVG